MEYLTKNKTYEVTIDSYSSEGHGVCRVDGRAVFVPRAILGEIWQIRIVKVTKTAVYARGEQLLAASQNRIAAPCPHFGKCGGCDTMHMCYEEELRFKLGRINDALVHIGGQPPLAIEILASDSVYRYRNKAIFNAAEADGIPSFGFYRERSHQLVPMEDCLLQSELSCRTAQAVLDFVRQRNIPLYDESNGRGCLRHIFCRQAFHGTDAVVCVVAACGFGAETAGLVEWLRERCPELSGIVLNINKTKGNTVLSGDFYTLWGNACIHDSLCGISFEIAPQAFFQINPPQAEKLYQRAIEYAIGKNNDLIFDLYCGAGTISLNLARHARCVIGAEIVPEAVENARKNAVRNGICNTEFICADAGEAAEALASRGLRPDCVVVDPPRKGMSETAVAAVASMNPDRIVYVSCDPSTLARDIRRFHNLGYTLQKVCGADMFPRTCHVESIAKLVRVES